MNNNFIPLSVPSLKGNELKYVTHAIETEWVSSGGSYIDTFESEISKYVRSTGAVACQSGTAGLHIALEVCGVTSSHEVIVPTLTFIAAVNPVMYVGAQPVFMDCDDSLCMDAAKLSDFCQNQCDFVDGKLINKKTKKHIKAMIVVHVFGNISNMSALLGTAKAYNLKFIEDATEALGSYYTQGDLRDKFAGTIGDIGVYSFNGNKIITTGGGGMIVSDNQSLLKRARHLTTQAKSDVVYFTHDEVGYNYRMTNVQAAIGLAQLEQLEQFIETKRTNYFAYKEEIEKIQGITLLSFDNTIRPNYWFYAMQIDINYKMNRDELIQYFHQNKVQIRPVWGLIHEQKPYLGFQAHKIQKASRYVESIVNIPCSSNLTSSDVLQVIKLLK